MLTPPRPENETQRLASLHGLAILDTPAEDRFDRITRLAQHLFDVPMALVSLVDDDRQWFKSCIGLDVRETPRDVSFCGHTILSSALFVVSDASRDPRFADNPLVTGQPRIRFYAGAPLTAPGGERVGTLCVISPEPREVTAAEQRLLADLAGLTEAELFYAELAQARQSAIEASRAKTMFLASVTHEIRTPVNAIIGSAELLGGGQLDPTRAELVRTIQCASESLLSLINGVLDMSKIEAGQLDLERAEFRLRAPLDDALRMVSVGAEAKGLSVVSNVASDLDLCVLGDSCRLLQVLLNLLQNAVKFTDDGSIVLGARGISRAPEQIIVRIEVTDTGIGIANDRLVHVFQPFRQAETSTTRRFGGTGLGLSISRQLVELMGGELLVASTLGEGTRFWFDLPFELRESTGTAAPPRDETPRSSYRLLLVDDNPLNRRVAMTQAARLGHEMTAVDSGAAALRELAPGHGYELVLMDLNMPGMNGLETTRTLRERESPDRRVPIIAMTASAFEDDRRACMEAGMDGFLPKPVRLEQLHATLVETIGAPPAA